MEKVKAQAILLPGEAHFLAILPLIIVVIKLVIICSGAIHYRLPPSKEIISKRDWQKWGKYTMSQHVQYIQATSRK